MRWAAKQNYDKSYSFYDKRASNLRPHYPPTTPAPKHMIQSTRKGKRGTRS